MISNISNNHDVKKMINIDRPEDEDTHHSKTLELFRANEITKQNISRFYKNNLKFELYNVVNRLPSKLERWIYNKNTNVFFIVSL